MSYQPPPLGRAQCPNHPEFSFAVNVYDLESDITHRMAVLRAHGGLNECCVTAYEHALAMLALRAAEAGWKPTPPTRLRQLTT